jgi:hypothetical protein
VSNECSTGRVFKRGAIMAQKRDSVFALAGVHSFTRQLRDRWAVGNWRCRDRDS